jgi:hypothetical protein
MIFGSTKKVESFWDRTLVKFNPVITLYSAPLFIDASSVKVELDDVKEETDVVICVKEEDNECDEIPAYSLAQAEAQLQSLESDETEKKVDNSRYALPTPDAPRLIVIQPDPAYAQDSW